MASDRGYSCGSSRPTSETFGELTGEIARLTAEDGFGQRPQTSNIGLSAEAEYVFTPASNDTTVVHLTDETASTRLDLGGTAFVGRWNPSRTKRFISVQTADEMAKIDHERTAVIERIGVGPSPHGTTSARVRP